MNVEGPIRRDESSGKREGGQKGAHLAAIEFLFVVRSLTFEFAVGSLARANEFHVVVLRIS